MRAHPAKRYAVFRRTMSKCSSSLRSTDAVLGQLVDLAFDDAQRDVAEQTNDLEMVLRERQRHRLRYRKSPKRTVTWLPHRVWTASRPRRSCDSSMMSSWTSVAV